MLVRIAVSGSGSHKKKINPFPYLVISEITLSGPLIALQRHYE